MSEDGCKNQVVRDILHANLSLKSLTLSLGGDFIVGFEADGVIVNTLNKNSKQGKSLGSIFYWREK